MNVLPPEKAINYLRNLIKDEVVTQIEKNNYEIEVMFRKVHFFTVMEF